MDEIVVRQPALKRAKLLLYQSAHLSQCLLFFDHMAPRPNLTTSIWGRAVPGRVLPLIFRPNGPILSRLILILPLVGTCNCQKLQAIALAKDEGNRSITEVST